MLPMGGLHVKHAVQRGIWAPTQNLNALRTTEKTFLLLRSADHTENTSLVIAKHYWDVTLLRLLGIWLPSRCLEAGCITPLFHCWCLYYLESAVSVAQPFLHEANTPQNIKR
jgi:hypothetical protein